MSAKRKMTAKNAKKVLDNILKMEKRDRDPLIKAFDTVLEAFCEDDFFGTECQNDPRGDGRED